MSDYAGFSNDDGNLNVPGSKNPCDSDSDSDSNDEDGPGGNHAGG